MNQKKKTSSPLPPGAGLPLSRRVLLRGAGGLMLAGLLPGCSNSGAPAQAPVTPRVRFLSDAELVTLRAVTERIIPEDQDPGAITGCCAETIDHLLAAFLTDPPLIYAGAPFSDRGGHSSNEFTAFVPLDAYEELAWRIHIEGSQGRPEREFNGPVKGLQAIYREGLARLDERASTLGQTDFASAPAPVQDQILAEDDDLIRALMDVAYPDTLDAMYGPPEYGGNCDLSGWAYTGFDGDVQPRGYTAEQVVNADEPGLFDPLLPPSYHDAAGSGLRTPIPDTQPRSSASLPRAPGSEEAVGLMNEGRWSAMRKRMQGGF